jgi:DNA-binding MarR family transcriptional regulator
VTYPLSQSSFADRSGPDLAAEIRTIIGALRAQTASDPDPRTLDQLRRARRQRDDFFSAKLFADPAWDMLLDLFAREIAQQRVTVSNVCFASGAPSTTALRYIELLRLEGLVTREADPLDQRRKFVRLTPEALESMRAYFRSLPDSILPI